MAFVRLGIDPSKSVHGPGAALAVAGLDAAGGGAGAEHGNVGRLPRSYPGTERTSAR